MQIIGKLHFIGATQQKTEKFSVREFVLDITEGQYSQKVLFQLANANTAILDGFQLGQDVEVSFDLRGREFQGQDGTMRYFNTLSAWKVVPYQAQGQYQQPMGMPQYQQPMAQQGFAMPMGAQGMPQQQYQAAPIQQMAAYQQQLQQQQLQQQQQGNEQLPF